MGDSRAIASKKGVVEQLSYDHKPSNDGKSVLFLVLTHMVSSFFAPVSNFPFVFSLI